MAKNINVVLSLQDKFTGKMSAIRYQTLAFKSDLALAQYAGLQAGKAMGVMETAAKKLADISFKAVTVGIASTTVAIKESLSSFYEYEKALNNSAAIREIEAQSKAYYQLSDSIKETVKTVKGATYTEGSTAIGHAFLAGWSEQEGINALPALLKGMKISGEDPAIVADALTDSMSALGLKPEQAEEYIDMATRIQALTNTNMLQIQNALIKSGAGYEDLFNGTNADDRMKTAKDLMIVGGLLANVGKKGEEAGTIVNSMFTRMTKATGETANGLESINVSLYDDKGKMRSVVEIFRDIAAALEPLTDKERGEALSLIGGRYRSQLTTIIDAFYELDEAGKTAWDTVIEGMENTSGASDKYLDVIYSGYSGKIMLLQSKLENFKISLGEVLAPYVTEFIGKLEEKLPLLEEKLDVLPNYLQQAREKIGSIKADVLEMIDKVQPFLNWLWEHKGGIGAVLATTYGGLGAFRLGVEGVTAYGTLSDFSKGLQKRANAKSKLKAKENAEILAGIASNTFNVPDFNFDMLRDGEILENNEIFENQLFTGKEAFYIKPQKYDTGKLVNDDTLSFATTTAALGGSGLLGKLSTGLAGFVGGISISTIATAVGGILAIGAGLYICYENSEKFRNSLKRLFGAGKGFFEKFFEGAKEGWQKVKPTIDEYKKTISLLGEVFGNAAGEMLEGLSGIAEKFNICFGDKTKKGIEAIGYALTPVRTYLEGINKALQAILDMFNDENWSIGMNKMFGGDWTGGITGNQYYQSGLNNKSKIDWFGNGEASVFGFDNWKLGFNTIINKIKGHALGTGYFSGGLTQINENGGEIVSLPTGTSIIPADKSERLIKGKNSDYIVNVYIDRFYGDDESYVNRMTDRIAGKLAEVM